MIEKLKMILQDKNEIIQKIYNAEPLDYSFIVNEILSWAKRLNKYIVNTDKIVMKSVKSKEKILLEGAQGVLLDIDHGTYPYVTSSNSTIGGAISGLGLNPKKINKVSGVFKSFCTRVGAGPFPTEIHGKHAEEIRQQAKEFGTTTGRPRRCGWLDLKALEKIMFVNSVTSLCITKLDVLDRFKEIKICIDYDENQDPIYKTFIGWKTQISNIKTFTDLPKEAQEYILFIETYLRCPVDIISVGPSRDQTIYKS